MHIFLSIRQPVYATSHSFASCSVQFFGHFFTIFFGYNLFNIIFLGLGASALCFVTWNLAVRELGAVKASVYIYMVPVITVITSAIVLQEKITLLVALGTILTMTGLFISEYRPKKKIK